MTIAALVGCTSSAVDLFNNLFMLIAIAATIGNSIAAATTATAWPLRCGRHDEPQQIKKGTDPSNKDSTYKVLAALLFNAALTEFR